MVNNMLKAAHKNFVDHITMAFVVNFLPPDLPSKIMNKKPATKKECVSTAHEAQRINRDKAQPVGATAKTRVLAVEEGSATSEFEEIFINLMKKHLKEEPTPTATTRTRAKARTPSPETTPRGTQQPRRSATTVENHGKEDCYSWKADKAMCYTAYYPKGELKGNQTGNPSSFKPAPPLSTARPQDFPDWVCVSP